MYASSARTNASPSILSVFARRRRRDVVIEAGSTTWLSIPSFRSTRSIQNPSRPASWMTTKGKTFPVLARAFFRSCAKRSSSPATSPPRTACFDIFSPPSGDSDVISHVDLLSSNETNIAPRSVRIAFGASGRSATVCMVVSRVGGRNLTLPERRSLSTSPWDLDQDLARRKNGNALKISTVWPVMPDDR